MFDGCRVTFDVEEGGKVAIGPIPSARWYHRLLGKGSTVPPPHDLVGCVSKNCMDIIEHPGLAWTEIEVMNSSGRWIC